MSKEGDDLFYLELQEIYEHGGDPKVLIIPGLGVMYYPALSKEEKAFIKGWLASEKYRREKI